jgi:hypothetical protein
VPLNSQSTKHARKSHRFNFLNAFRKVWYSHKIFCNSLTTNVGLLRNCCLLALLQATSMCRYPIFFMARQPLGGLGLVILRRFTITLIDTPRSVGLLWTRDQLVETSTWQHTTLTRDRHPCPRWGFIFYGKLNCITLLTKARRLSLLSTESVPTVFRIIFYIGMSVCSYVYEVYCPFQRVL